MSQKIVIFTQSPLSKAPRVVKEANSLFKCGYNIIIFSVWYNEDVVCLDKALLDDTIKYFPGIDLRNKRSCNVFFLRVLNKLSRYFVRFFNLQYKQALGYGYNTYLKRLLNEHADLYIGHEEMSLQLVLDLKKKNNKVVFDFEDFHSEDLLPNDRIYRPLKLIERLEKEVLLSADLTLTTSNQLAFALSRKYKSKTPEVIYNSFEFTPKNKIKTIENSMVWISQIIGPGRGLELLFETLCFVKCEFSIHFIGENHLFNINKYNIPKNIKLVFHNSISPKEIPQYLTQFDIGVAIEDEKPLSRDCTVTNKVFHYLNSGLGILATNTKGQSEIKSIIPEAMLIVDRNPAQMAKQIDQLFSNKSLIVKMKTASLDAGKTTFNYAAEEKKLSKYIKNVLSN